MDPAVQEALNSQNIMFQDEEFDKLKEWYQLQNVEQAMEDVSQQLEDNYNQVQNILSEQEEIENIESENSTEEDN